MEIIIHRINTIKGLKKIPQNFGVEIDVRSYKKKIILNHEPYRNGDSFRKYIKNYKHGTLVINIKESGIEDDIIKIIKKNKKIKSYFLLDVEIPYLFYSLKKKEKSIALRTSYYEPFQNLKFFKKHFNWIWIDTIKKPNFTSKEINKIKSFKKCLVCPERWGKPMKIFDYFNYFKKNRVKIDAVMTSMRYSKIWARLSANQN
jgi:hypothetical protein